MYCCAMCRWPGTLRSGLRTAASPNHHTAICPSRDRKGVTSSDRTLLSHPLDLVGAVAGEAGQHLLGVLAVERRTARRDRRLRQPYRATDHREAAAGRVVEVEHRAAFAQMRVGQHLAGVEHG